MSRFGFIIFEHAHVENRNAIFGRMNIDKVRIHNVHNNFIWNAYFLRKHNLH